MGACDEALPSVRGLSAREAWEKCERGDWMLWVYGRMAGAPGWPTKLQIAAVLAELVTDQTRHFVRAFSLLEGDGAAFVAAAVVDASAPVGLDRTRLLRDAAVFIRQRLGGPWNG